MAHIDIWMRLMDYRDEYLLEQHMKYETKKKSAMKFNKSIRKIERILCMLNYRASNISPSIALVSRALTSRLVKIFSHDTSTLPVKPFSSSILYTHISKECIDNQTTNKY